MKKLIAIVGMSGTGKSVATTYLENKGYKKIYFGGVICNTLKEKGIEVTPDNEKKLREDLRKKHGMGVVAKLLLPQIEDAYNMGDTVLDGLYSWDEYLILKERFKDLKLICICTDKKIRYNRVSKRKVRPLNQEEIIKRDVAEIENAAKGGPIAFADYYILNNGDLNAFYNRLEEILESIEQEGEK